VERVKKWDDLMGGRKHGKVRRDGKRFLGKTGLSATGVGKKSMVFRGKFWREGGLIKVDCTAL